MRDCLFYGRFSMKEYILINSHLQSECNSFVPWMILPVIYPLFEIYITFNFNPTKNQILILCQICLSEFTKAVPNCPKFHINCLTCRHTNLDTTRTDVMQTLGTPYKLTASWHVIVIHKMFLETTNTTTTSPCTCYNLHLI